MNVAKLIEELGKYKALEEIGQSEFVAGWNSCLNTCLPLVKKHMETHPCSPCPDKERCQPELRIEPCILFSEKKLTANEINILEVMRHMDERLAILEAKEIK